MILVTQPGLVLRVTGEVVWPLGIGLSGVPGLAESHERMCVPPLPPFPHHHSQARLDAVPSMGRRVGGSNGPPAWLSIRLAGPLQVVTAQRPSQGGHSGLSRMDSSGTDADERNAPGGAHPPAFGPRPRPLACAAFVLAAGPWPRTAQTPQTPQGPQQEGAVPCLSFPCRVGAPTQTAHGPFEDRLGAVWAEPPRTFSRGLGQPPALRPASVQEIRGGRENRSAVCLKEAEANAVDP